MIMRPMLASVVACAVAFAVPGGAAAKVIDDSDLGHTLKGTKRADTIQANGGDDTLWGYRGSDRLYGGGGNDRIFGGRGPDLLVDRAGHGGQMDGGSADDRIRMHRAPGDHSSSSDGSMAGGSGDDVLHLTGGNGVDIKGGPGRDTIYLHGGGGYWIVVEVAGDGTRDDVWCHADTYERVFKGPLDVLHRRDRCDVVFDS
jgi:hypothetical protein